MLSLKRIFQAAFFSTLLCSAASATTIDFTGITIDRGTFTTYSENGYTVTAVSGDWLNNTSNYGDPVPSIFDEHTTGSIDIADGGSLFTFSGLEIGNFEEVSETYTISGYRSGVQEFTTTGSLSTATSAFLDFGTGYSSDSIDKLVITLAGNSEANVDNIVVNNNAAPATTPEPESLTLNLTGAAGIAVLRRRLAASLKG